MALGFASATLGPRGREAGARDLPAALIGSGLVILGGAVTLRLGESLLGSLDGRSFQPFALARGLGPVALGALTVGLLAGYAAPAVGRWRWGLLLGFPLGLLPATVGALALVAPEALEALASFALGEPPDVGEVRRSVVILLGVLAAYPVVTLLAASAGATAGAHLGEGATGLGRGRPRAAVRSAPEAEAALVEEARTSSAPLRFVPVGESWCHRVFDGDTEIAFLELGPGTAPCGFEWEGSYYRIESDLVRRSYMLVWRGRPLARAEGGLLGSGFRLLVGARSLSLRLEHRFLPGLGTFLLEEGGQRIGSVLARRGHPDGGLAELPPDLPLPVRLFVIHLALVSRMRRGRAWRP